MADDSPSPFSGIASQGDADPTLTNLSLHNSLILQAASDPAFGGPVSTAMQAILAGPDHPAYGNPQIRPWIDLLTPQDYPLGPGVLHEGMQLLVAQGEVPNAGPSSPQTPSGP